MSRNLRPSLLLLLTLALVPTAASAATYWVSPTGVAGRSGADSTANATTLAWFNANAVAGDVCRFKSGTYTDPIFPAVNGTASSRVRYYGFPQSRGAVVVADIHFGYQKGSYCTARWVTCPNGITGCDQAAGISVTGDSIVACVARGGGIGIHGKSSVVDSVSLTGTITDTGQSHFVDLSGTRDHYNGSIGEWSNGATNNQFTNSIVNLTVNTTASLGDVHAMLLSAAAYNRIAGNTFNTTVNNCFGYFFAVEMYEGYNNVLQNNTWTLVMNATPGGSHGVWCHRDSSSYNRYIGNTVTVLGPGALSFMITNPGSFGQTTGHNMFSNNFIRDDSPQGGTGVFWYYDGVRQDTLQFNTFITSSGASLVNIPSGAPANGIVLRHNTYMTAGSTAIDFAHCAAPTNNSRLVSEIFYCGAANGAGTENVRVVSGFGLDSSGVYFSRGSSSASRAISVAGLSGAPGSGGANGIAGEAVWGSPMFADSSYANFNGTPTAASAAARSGLFDGYAGAIPFGGGAQDVTPPATVTDLTLGQPGGSSLLISWTAPGNDGMTGTAALYDLRWSRSAITSANFAAATAVSPQPVPQAGGTAQSYVALGLASGTTYWFALRARDPAGNWSAVSNVPSAATSGDAIPPAAIKDLTTSP